MIRKFKMPEDPKVNGGTSYAARLVLLAECEEQCPNSSDGLMQMSRYHISKKALHVCKTNPLLKMKATKLLFVGLVYGFLLSGCSQADSPQESKAAGDPIVNLYKKWGDRAVEGALDSAKKREESDRKFQEDLDRKLLDGKISHEEYLKIRATKSEAEQKEVGDAMDSLLRMQKKQLEQIERLKQSQGKREN